jgi:endoglucanase
LSTNFGYDAMRLPWRIALDAQWFNEPRAETTLAKMEFLNRQWQAESRIASTYTHDGREFLAYESPAMYGGSLGYFLLAHPETATAIYRDKLLTLFDPDTTRWKKVLSYYDDNIAWFGIGLYQKSLTNLSAGVFSKNSFPNANIPKSINANPETQ